MVLKHKKKTSKKKQAKNLKIEPRNEKTLSKFRLAEFRRTSTMAKVRLTCIRLVMKCMRGSAERAAEWLMPLEE